jgi:DNA-binding NarL/FixJ family response regulator
MGYQKIVADRTTGNLTSAVSEMRILIADYYALLRDGLGILVKELSEDVVICHCESYEGAVDALTHDAIDMALIDFNLPNLNGAASIHSLHEQAPTVPLVVMATSERWNDACAAIDAGARGYIPKSASSAIMIAALRLILSGGTYLPPLLSQAGGGGQRTAYGRAGPNGGGEPGIDRKLTPRQQEVLQCLARGQSNKEIAYQLGLSQGTVKIHIAAIFRAYKVRNRTQAVIAAGIHG